MGGGGDKDKAVCPDVEFREASFPVLLVPLKGPRSMTACPLREALGILWLETPISAAESIQTQPWPGSGCWPSDLKVSAWHRSPEDMLGVMLCHTGGSQHRSNRRTNHMLVTFWRMSLSMSAPTTAFRSVRPSWFLTFFPSPTCSFWSYCSTIADIFIFEWFHLRVCTVYTQSMN